MKVQLEDEDLVLKFSSQQRQSQSYKQKKPPKRSKISHSYVRWNEQEDIVYINFLKQNAQLFETQFVRRASQVFMKLSEQMNGLKTPKQCKSHHQKMQKMTKGGTILQIVDYLKNKLEKAKKSKFNKYCKDKGQKQKQKSTREDDDNEGKVNGFKIQTKKDRGDNFDFKIVIDLEAALIW